MLALHSRDHHVTDAELCPKLARTPVCRIDGLTLDAPLQDASFYRRGERRWQLTRMAAEQACQTLGEEALNPAIDEAVSAVELVADRRPRVPAVEQQDEPRTTRLIGTPRLAGGR